MRECACVPVRVPVHVHCLFTYFARFPFGVLIGQRVQRRRRRVWAETLGKYFAGSHHLFFFSPFFFDKNENCNGACGCGCVCACVCMCVHVSSCM